MFAPGLVQHPGGLAPIARSIGEQRDIDRERAEAAKAVVADLRPDILVLNEALFCRQFLGRTVDYAGLFAFPYPGGGAL